MIIKVSDDPPLYAPNTGQTGLAPAENIGNLPGGHDYYMRQTAGKDREWIKVFLEGDYGSIMSGKPVYPEYVDQLHAAKEDFHAYKGLPIVLGWDAGGMTPALVICQVTPKGQLRILDELMAEDTGMRGFIRVIVRPFLHNYYPNMTFMSYGDPAGNSRQASSEVTCMQILREEGIPTQMARTNEFVARRESVATFLSRMVDGEPGMVLSPRCKTIRKGFLGGFHFAKRRVSTGERFSDRPEKNIYSHLHDGLQYACMSLLGDLPDADNQFRGNSRRREVVTSPAAGWT